MVLAGSDSPHRIAVRQKKAASLKMVRKKNMDTAIENYIETLEEKDYLNVNFRDTDKMFEQLNAKTKITRVEFNDEHYLVLFKEGGKEVKGPYASIDDAEDAASEYVDYYVSSTLAERYIEIDGAQFNRARIRKLNVVIDKYGQAYIVDDDYEAVIDEREEERKEEEARRYYEMYDAEEEEEVEEEEG
jgi:hypothetical protein